MTLTENILKQKRSAVIILISAVALGVIYPFFADQKEDWIARVNGFLIGLFGGLTIVIFELHIFFFPKRIHSFTYTLLSKVLTYTITILFLILFTIILTRSYQNDISILSYLQSESFRYFLLKGDFNVIIAYSLVSTFLIVTTRQISRKMGRGVLFNYIIGRYHQPKNEHRIFLAFDLVGSTWAAERLGESRYHEFIKQYFYDLSNSIALHNGEIYRYVGDLVMVSWLIQDGLKNNDAMECYFDAQKIIQNQKNVYQNEFNFIPEFRAVMDVGEVLAAEIALDKKQLAFYGDVIGRIAQIEKISKRENENFILSEYIATLLRQSKNFDLKKCAAFLVYESVRIELFSVTKNEKGR